MDDVSQQIITEFVQGYRDMNPLTWIVTVAFVGFCLTGYLYCKVVLSGD